MYSVSRMVITPQDIKVEFLAFLVLNSNDRIKLRIKKKYCWTEPESLNIVYYHMADELPDSARFCTAS